MLIIILLIYKWEKQKHLINQKDLDLYLKAAVIIKEVDQGQDQIQIQKVQCPAIKNTPTLIWFTKNSKMKD